MDNEVEEFDHQYVKEYKGEYKIKETLVSLESIISKYLDGTLPDQIAKEFDLKLEQVHGALAFYLANKENLKSYLSEKNIDITAKRKNRISVNIFLRRINLKLINFPLKILVLYFRTSISKLLFLFILVCLGTFLFVLLSFITSKLEIYVSDIQNISQEKAIQIAKDKFYVERYKFSIEDVLYAIPFKNTGENFQYIATAIESKNDANSCYIKIILLKGYSSNIYNTYKKEEVNLKAYDQFTCNYTNNNSLSKAYLTQIFGVVDINGDGKKEIYAIQRDGGNSVYSIQVSLYDSYKNATYKIDVSGGYTSKLLDLNFTPDILQNKEAVYWMLKKSEELNLSNRYSQ